MKLQATNDEMKLTDGNQTYVCTYNAILDSRIPLVVESKASLLQEIQLDDMLVNLDNSAELLNIALWALYRKTGQGDLDGLQVTLLKLCAKSKVTMRSFRDNSEAITVQILGSYGWMRKGMVQHARLIFNSTAQYAAQMAKQSSELSAEFDALANQTIDVLKKVEVEHADEIKGGDDLESTLQSMQAENDKQTSLVKGLLEDVTSINLEYQEAKKELKSAEKRELGLGIASMYVGALSLGLGALAKGKGAPTVNLGKIDQLNKQKQEALDQFERIVVLVNQSNNEKITTNTILQILLVSIQCLKKAALSLSMTSMYWNSLKQYCEKISNPTLSQLLDSVKKLPKEESIELFEDEDFAMSILTYTAQWAAMYYISDEYSIVANKTYDHTNKNFSSMPSEGEMMNMVRQRSTAILSNISSQKRDS